MQILFSNKICFSTFHGFKKNASGVALLFQNYANPPLKFDVVTRAPLW